MRENNFRYLLSQAPITTHREDGTTSRARLKRSEKP